LAQVLIEGSSGLLDDDQLFISQATSEGSPGPEEEASIWHGFEARLVPSDMTHHLVGVRPPSAWPLIHFSERDDSSIYLT
jgi:hypothetical protein